MASTVSKSQAAAMVKQWAADLQFDLCGITAAVQPPGFHPFLEWLASGYAADMDWIERRKDAYAHPNGVLPGTQSVIVVALNYHQGGETTPGCRISRYAWGEADYHNLLKKRLKQLCRQLREALPDEITRPVVDTAPLLERDFARLAGLGWQGKNTMLINRGIGSWFFLGAILTTAPMQADHPFDDDHCGTCTQCLDACPTDAFPQPGTLNAERCISYLTIERRGKTISPEFMAQMQDWVFGCDVCQDVCPWNRFAPGTAPEGFHLRPELRQLDVLILLQLTDDSFQNLFRKTPLERTGRDVLVRNAAIAAANRNQQNCIPILQQLTDDSSELVRHAATWSLTRLKEQTGPNPT